MKKIIFFVTIVLPFATIAQKTITGKVFDASNNRPLPQANIVMKNGNGGTVTGTDGIFILSLPGNIKTITVSHVGYQSRILYIDSSVIQYSIGLQPASEQQEVIVIGSRNLARTNVQTPVPVD